MPKPLVATEDANVIVYERKAIAFIDCCGYSAFTDAHGDRAAVELHLSMRGHIEREAAAAHVMIVKWLGDGVMLAADDSRAILTCVYRAMIAVRASGSLPLRGGLTVGPVARIAGETTDYLGTSVNRAAHLCAAAAPWQLHVVADSGRIRLTLGPRRADS